MALKLQRLGIHRVRPLLGGLEGWLELKLPTESSLTVLPAPQAAEPLTEAADAPAEPAGGGTS